MDLHFRIDYNQQLKKYWTCFFCNQSDWLLWVSFDEHLQELVYKLDYPRFKKGLPYNSKIAIRGGDGNTFNS